METHSNHINRGHLSRVPIMERIPQNEDTLPKVVIWLPRSLHIAQRNSAVGSHYGKAFKGEVNLPPPFTSACTFRYGVPNNLGKGVVVLTDYKKL